MFYDFFGALASLLSTYLFIRVNPTAWLIGMVATSINVLLYWEKGIYADMCLEAFYFLSTCLGWYLWIRNNDNQKSSGILQLNKWQWVSLLLVTSLIYLVIYLILTKKTPSTIPHLDALTTSLSLLAQLLLCYKVLATWIFWFITDSIYIYMYFHKDIPFHGILMIIYTGMAIAGYITWKKLYYQEMSPPSEQSARSF